MEPKTDGERSVELYVRSLAPGGTHHQQDAVVRRLDELLDEGVVTTYDVRVWGDRIRSASPCARTTDGRHVRDRLARIEEWADEVDRSLEGVYREVERESTITDESWTEIRFPQQALAEFVDDELVHFAPSRAPDGDLVRVTDRLEALSASDDGPAADGDGEASDGEGTRDRRTLEAGPAER